MSNVSLARRQDEVWLCSGKYEVHILSLIEGEVVLMPVDPVMARVIGIELDEAGYINTSRTFP